MEPQQGQDAPQNDETTSSAPHFSRRTMLKALGVTVIGSVVPIIPLATHIATAETVAVGAMKDSWAIAAASPIFLKAMSQLKIFQFGFLVDQVHFRSVAEEAPLVGLLLQQSTTPSQRTGVSVLCTVDTATRTLRALQYVIGWCLESSLEITSVLLDAQSLQPQFLQTRGGLMEMPGKYQEQHWSFGREIKDIQPLPKILPLDGWPLDSLLVSPWFYQGSTAVDWVGAALRNGAGWYRNRYNHDNPLPLDILLSEMGPDWQIEPVDDQHPIQNAGLVDGTASRMAYAGGILGCAG